MTGRAAGGFKLFYDPSSRRTIPTRGVALPDALPKMAKRFGQCFFRVQFGGPTYPPAVLDLFAGILRGVHAFVVEFYFRQAGVCHKRPSVWCADQNLPILAGASPIEVDVRNHLIPGSAPSNKRCPPCPIPNVPGGGGRNGLGLLFQEVNP